ncbi:hypothetical protein GOP47_0001918 [Adiantum capillus-veneris]|uniref:BHLH domain-containing protein n=1 Tax=Adiantum capillus-veneris TaxID=13818 RepID=A0A9D4V9Y2_ADICA|nr:hypothetical protein GOP47_0001918 [Adiantum capillus-veneris]
MGVQVLQSEGLHSQLMQVGNLLHIGQHETANSHKWKQHARGGGGGGGGGGGEGSNGNGSGGYFKALLEGEADASISSASSSLYNHVHAEDSKPLLLRSLEINGAHHSLRLPPNAGINLHKSPINRHISKSMASPLCSSEPKLSSPSTTTNIISSPLKRAREICHIEGISKREKKGSEEGMKEKGKKGMQQAADPTGPAGRKATSGGGSVKTKVPKPAPAELPKTDYVHVRARRGQATDSHSLAERVRREKISERMRFLQDLVPGCSKITGKALILDEIINYVQSLQNQVEFLAMRLAAAIHPKLEYASLSNSTEEEIASPFVEEVRDGIGMLPKTAMTMHTPTSDLHFDTLSAFYPGLFDESNFNPSIVSDLSTSTCNDSDLTNMDFSHLA